MKDPVLGYACGELAPMWSHGLADLAVENPQLAAALERAGNLGAGAGLLSAAVMTGVQIGHLLGKVPAPMAKMMGVRTREEIEQLLEQRGIELRTVQAGCADEDAGFTDAPLFPEETNAEAQHAYAY
ncbi:hypothetical protein E4K10_49950 [Streptomyces sp. T1317-0309]|nr:hypothetical protein E4K10_49950 [Streptomyces sp. T1317-0309]